MAGLPSPSRSWLPIVEAPGYHRQPTSICDAVIYVAFQVYLPGWVATTPSSLLLKALLYFSFFSKFFRLRKMTAKQTLVGNDIY